VADAFVSKGLQAAGYEYLNLDDCWMDSSRDADGKLQGHLENFPSGMKALGDYIHSKGLKFGIYGDRGTKTCAGWPGNLGTEQLDAQTYADWGVDYLKEDNCDGPTGANDKDEIFRAFSVMRDALNATGRPIFFSVCGGGDQLPGALADITYYATDPRGGGSLANAWRISSDVIEWQTSRMASIATNDLAQFAGEGGFNDPDMLLGSSNSSTRSLSQKHSRSQFNLWSILMAPLMIGANLRQLDDFDLETYTNQEVIAVNQDTLLKQGKRVMHSASAVYLVDSAVWAKELSDGSVAMMFENNYPVTSSVYCDAACWDELPFAKGTALEVRDLWAHGPAEVPTAIAGEEYRLDVSGNGGSFLFRMSPKASVLV
jgi:alpha-galactosidase